MGTDPGPLHRGGAAGCRATVLFSAASDPALTAPRGPAVEFLRCDRLGELAVDTVAARVLARLDAR